MTEERGEHWTSGPLVHRTLERAADLAEHLGLSGHRRLQAGGDLEEMTCHATVEVDRLEILDRCGRQS